MFHSLFMCNDNMYVHGALGQEDIRPFLQLQKKKLTVNVFRQQEPLL